MDYYHGKYVEELKNIYRDWSAEYKKEKTERLLHLEKDPDRRRILEAKHFKDLKGDQDELTIS